MKKMFGIAVVLTVLVLSSSVFAYDPGVIKGAIVQYNSSDTDTLKISTGYGDCAGKAWHIVSEITTTTITDPNDDVFVYVYIDYSAINTNEDLTSGDIYTSTDEPAWDANKFGCYHQTTDTDDRCIGVVWWDDTNNEVKEFFGIGNDTKIVWATSFTAASAMTPDDTWDDPDDLATSTRLPVNASETLVTICGKDLDPSPQQGYSVAIASEFSSSVTNWWEAPGVVAQGYGWFSETGWLKLGSSRNIKVRGQGSPNQDDAWVYLYLLGYDIQR